MKKLIGGMAFFLMLGAVNTGAQAAPWCAYYDHSTYNCGFYSYEQCLATIRGVGGYCSRNYFEGYASNPRPSTRKPRRRY
jgi:hypothetical protein